MRYAKGRIVGEMRAVIDLRAAENISRPRRGAGVGCPQSIRHSRYDNERVRGIARGFVRSFREPFGVAWADRGSR